MITVQSLTTSDEVARGQPFTLAVLVDALRPDYVRREWMPFLHKMAAQSAAGTLRECFGFVVARAAYFAGLSTEEYGFTNMYCFDPEHSPFSIARSLPGGEMDAKTAADLRAFVDQVARERMSPFARGYANSAEIPLAWLSFFDLVEKHAPWESAFGHESLFDVLDDVGIQWQQTSWPGTNRLLNQSDDGIVQHTLDKLTPEHRFAYVHLQELDAVGHQYGPNSIELQLAMNRTDDCCRELIETARERYGDVNVVLFGDHGMVNVTRTLNLLEILENTGLQFGTDYVFFLDSTMARFWFFHRAARRTVEQVLKNVEGGCLLDKAALEHYEIFKCDSSNGELIFLADPGVLIFPNFFQGSGEPIKGMHGYDPDCADNLGFFLIHRSSDFARGEFGKVDPQVIYPCLLELTGFNAVEHTAVSLPEIKSVVAGPLYTCHEKPAANQAVEDQLNHILKAINEKVGTVEAVVLTGSFGRGEGGVYQDAGGRWCPVNDYDLIVADPRDLNEELAGLGAQLARELQIDYVDLAYSDGRWENLQPTIFNYDLKYGSRVIAGDVSILDKIPAYAAVQFVADDPVRLLLNRIAGLLSGIRGSYLEGCCGSADEQRYLTNQMVKAWIAVGDSYLMIWNGYDSSYLRRKERFVALAPGAGVAPERAACIERAYAFKCMPEYAAFDCGLTEMRKLHAALEEHLIGWVGRLTGNPATDLSAALNVYIQHYCQGEEELPLRYRTYAALPLLLAGIIESRSVESFNEAQTVFNGSIKECFAVKKWEQLRADVVAAWFAVCH